MSLLSSPGFAGLKDVDGLGELPGTPGAAAELAQDAPGLELGISAFTGSAELRRHGGLNADDYQARARVQQCWSAMTLLAVRR